ncbi:unnamed protein product [Aphanomyces euteiches]|uniref:Calcineurin-like phosphoesterase domain-containing protein n=1 Tax=Aphanomyces euteiches TaxID=100861 RepID=A0A6G0WKQ2_9STRA|nr:hypothetical protein Ae201684_014200 [Aphanomyces euteiches]KAH9068693.1 hypothetical protein Ae201684P_004395 [Aphanomyces euteiches]KAH9139928.1 hypothetical protein AeRB84_015795 [Aphanomyces euteiches]
MEASTLLEPAKTKRSPVRPKVVTVGLLGVAACVGLVVYYGSTPTTKDSRVHRPLESSGALPTEPLEDPELAEPAITFLAIGDWGGTLGKGKGDPGTCCKLYNGGIDFGLERYKVDFYSQAYVAELMAQSATELHPLRILGHGDNFYWNGVGTKDAKYRFEHTFERVYNATSLRNIPWLNVVGNHDIGGATFICGDKETELRECESLDELVKYMDLRFEAQANYTSPHNNRWVLRGHYYVERVSKHNVTVDVYNIDTNHADNHGGKDVCCQCYGYTAKLGIENWVCNDVQPGDLGCVGGNVTLYNACMDKVEGWAHESLVRALADAKSSPATFKIINTHYSPHYHMNNEKMEQWYELCREAGIAAWFNGHTHGFNHDISNWGTHFFQNGGGGGYFTDNNAGGVDNGSVYQQWVVEGSPYGFMELSFSKDWLKVQFATFDDKWDFGGLHYNETTIGGIQRGHCWFIPRTFNVNHAIGVECNSSINGAIGAPLIG